VYRWHAGDAWSAPISIQAQLKANDTAQAEIAAANEIVNNVFASEAVVA
jgi:hypothetical protein